MVPTEHVRAAERDAYIGNHHERPEALVGSTPVAAQETLVGSLRIVVLDQHREELQRVAMSQGCAAGRSV